VREKHGEDDQSEIGFQDVRASQVFEKRECPAGIARSDNQICEQDRKGKNDDDCARHVDDGKYNREERIVSKALAVLRSGKT